LAEKLKIMSLGGLGEIGKNMTVLEYGKDMILIDCGLGFPEDDMYGIDLVIPDASYVVKNQQKLRGVFLTHGHEDHIGALPYLLREFQTTIHGTALTLGLVRRKLEEHGLDKTTKLVTHRAGDVIRAGCFEVELIHVNHSIADAVAYAVKTPIGKVVITGDFKIDPTDPEGMMDLARLGQLGNEGVLALLCESTNVERPGQTMSEKKIGETFEKLLRDAQGRVIVAMFASNIHRMQMVIDNAIAYGRKVCFIGRSMVNVSRVGIQIGELHIPEDVLIEADDLDRYEDHEILVMTTGSQGEAMAGLTRMAYSEHRKLQIRHGHGDHLCQPHPGQ